jgi:hypothetical protein
MKKHIIVTTIVFLAVLSPIWAAGTPVKLSSIDTELKNDYAIDSFGDYYITGIGFGAQTDFDLTFIDNFGFFASLDYFFGISKTIWVDSFQDLSAMAGISYTIFPDGEISIIPEIGYGIDGHLLLGDVDRDGTSAPAFYMDQLLNFSVKFLYPLNEGISIYMSPELTLFIESENNAILAGYDLGVRINL